MRAVRSAEGIIDIDITKRGEVRTESGYSFWCWHDFVAVSVFALALFLGVEAEVFEEKNCPRCWICARPPALTRSASPGLR